MCNAAPHLSTLHHSAYLLLFTQTTSHLPNPSDTSSFYPGLARTDFNLHFIKEQSCTIPPLFKSLTLIHQAHLPPSSPGPTQSQQPPLPPSQEGKIILSRTPYPSRTITPMIRTQHRTSSLRVFSRERFGRLQQDISIHPPSAVLTQKKQREISTPGKFFAAKGENFMLLVADSKGVRPPQR